MHVWLQNDRQRICEASPSHSKIGKTSLLRRLWSHSSLDCYSVSRSYQDAVHKSPDQLSLTKQSEKSTTTMNSFKILCLPLALSAVAAEIYNGTVGLGCSSGSCNFTGVCQNLAVPGTFLGNGVYTNITGDVFLSPSTCQAECTERCDLIAEPDPGCIGNAGYVYCPETDNCIRPWEENCPFEGSLFVGPTNITCVNGRCNNLAPSCNVAFESAILGGPYVSGMNGEFELSSDCYATCAGCTGDSAPTDSTPTPAPPTTAPTASNSAGLNAHRLAVVCATVAMGLCLAL